MKVVNGMVKKSFVDVFKEAYRMLELLNYKLLENKYRIFQWTR